MSETNVCPFNPKQIEWLKSNLSSQLVIEYEGDYYHLTTKLLLAGEVISEDKCREYIYVQD